MRDRIIYHYEITFETGGMGNRVQVEQSGFNITEVIKNVRRDYPDAHLFIVLKKKKQPQPTGLRENKS